MVTLDETDEFGPKKLKDRGEISDRLQTVLLIHEKCNVVASRVILVCADTHEKD